MNQPHEQLSDFLPEYQIAITQLAKQLNNKKVLVTGAGGFLGSALCRFLRVGNINVIGFARGNYPHLKALGVQLIQGDLQDVHTVNAAVKECAMVFHVASKAGVWGDKNSYFGPNVLGTENIIKACEVHKVSRLIYTSTPSVTFEGKDESGIDESQPYAEHFLNYYGLSKAIAEKRILEANHKALKTVALRPHLIWGPNDPHLVPRVIERAKQGKLTLVGKTDKLVDTIYIDNAVYAHLLAAITLDEENSACAGKAYFLSNDQPIYMATMLNKILAAAKLPPVQQRIPSSVAYFVGSLLERWYKITKNKNEPIMTRFVAKQLSTSHYFNIDAAKQDFHYKALISIDEGMKQLHNSLQA